MTREPELPEWLPPNGGPIRVGRRPGFRGYDPFYAFKQAARDDGKPYKSPEPKAERELLALLGTKAALVAMSCLVAFVAATLLVLLVVRL
jgi:hypothetical protein